MNTRLPTPEMVRNVLKYDADTGLLFWLERGPDMFSEFSCNPKRAAKAFNTRYAGKVALTSKCNRGYARGKIFMQNAYAHRVAWCIYYGKWPDFEVDHINQNKSDNRISNLRAASPSQNRCNRGAQKNSKSGVKGVFPSVTKGKWIARIRVNGVQIHLGTFPDVISAKREYDSYAKTLHGEFATL
jgi:hypothetical protein